MSGNSSTPNSSTPLQDLTCRSPEVLVPGDKPRCVVPQRTWEDFVFAGQVCVITWFGLFVLGMLLSRFRNTWDAKRVARMIRTPLLIVTTTAFYLLPAALVSLFFCGVNLYQAVHPDPSEPLMYTTIEQYATYVHLLEFIVVWIDALANSPTRVLEFSCTRMITDVALIVPVLMRLHFGFNSTLSVKYIGITRAYTMWYLFCKSRRSTPFMRSLGWITLLLAIMVGCANAVLQVETLPGEEWPIEMHPGFVELKYTDGIELADAPPYMLWSFSASVYFVLATCTTVGFGDMFPRTVLGQLFMIIIACTGFIQILKCLMGMARAYQFGTQGGGFYASSNRSKHIVVAGSFSYPVIRTFLEEIYHEDHAIESEDLDTVILFLPEQKQQMADTRLYLRQHGSLLHRVRLLRATALKHQDLDRACYREAASAFLLPNMFAPDPEREDLDNIMRALSMQNHTSFVRIVPLLLQVENRQLMVSTGVKDDDIVCINEIKLGLFGTACQVSGFTTLVLTLMQNVGQTSQTGYDADNFWSEHYRHGIENEIYEQALSLAYMEAPFFDVSRDILRRSNGGAYLIGVVEESLYPGDPIITRMFPGRYARIGMNKDRKVTGIFIARDLSAIKQQPEKEVFKWSIGEKARVARLEKAALNQALPNAVPDPEPAQKTTTSSFILPNGKTVYHYTPGKSGWVIDPFAAANEKAETVTSTMLTAAYSRASQGLKSRTDKTQREADFLLGRKVQALDSSEAALKAEDEARAKEDGDEAAKAVSNQLANVQRSAAEEKKEFERKKRVKEHQKLSRDIKFMVDAIEAGEKEVWKSQQDDAQAIKEDIDLCGAPEQRLKVFGSPEEPPAWVLARGGHVIFLALEGQVDLTDTSGNAGSRLSLTLFTKALRSGDDAIKRPVVVIAERVPLDWPEIAAEGDVYLSVGQALSAEGLRRAGLRHAHAVVIHHNGNAKGKDAYKIDAEAIFACRVVDEVLCQENKDCRVICDLVLESNASYVPLSKHEKHKAKVIMDFETEKEKEMDAAEQKHTDADVSAFITEPRFITGQLFCSTTLISLVANQLYNHALGSMVRELVNSQIRAVPIPDEWRGKTFGQLFEYMMLRKNLLVLALLRRQDAEVEVYHFEDDEEEEVDDKDKDVKKERWHAGEPSWRHYCYVMPQQDRLVAEHDGLLCVLPSEGDPVLET